MVYTKEKTIESFVADSDLFDKKIKYRMNIIFLSILISYVIYVSPFYLISFDLISLSNIVLAQSIGLILVSHIAITAYSFFFNSLHSLWSNKNKAAMSEVRINKYVLKIMISDIILKTLLVFFVSSIFFSKDHSFFIATLYFLIIKVPEVKRWSKKKYSEVLFSMIVSALALLISVSFVSVLIVTAMEK